MSFSCNTNNFPSVDSYADAKRYFDSVKPWRGGDTNERPIGTRSHKHKVMRQLRDGSIAFQLYQTDCAVWHPDNTVTVTGYASMSTTAFLSALLPSSVSHGQGSTHDYEPVLELRARGANRWTRHTDEHGFDRWKRNCDVQVIQCSKPVKLYYSAEADRWDPADVLDLEPFRTKVIDRKAARAVAKQYHLSDFEAVITAILALGGEPSKPTGCGSYGDIMTLLEDGDLLGALNITPRGARYSFGRTHGSKDGIEPGFLKKLRDHIYGHEGALTTVERPILTVSQYEAHKRASKRF